MNYLKFSNIPASLIDSNVINGFLELAKEDKRVNKIEYIGINNLSQHIFKIESIIDGEILELEATLGRVASNLHESNLERKARLAKAEAQEQQRQKLAAEASNTLFDKFVEIAKKNGATIAHLRRYHDSIFSGRFMDQDAKWCKSASQTIEDFNEFQYGKPISFADFNFLRDNFRELSKAL